MTYLLDKIESREKLTKKIQYNDKGVTTSAVITGGVSVAYFQVVLACLLE